MTPVITLDAVPYQGRSVPDGTFIVVDDATAADWISNNLAVAAPTPEGLTPEEIAAQKADAQKQSRSAIGASGVLQDVSLSRWRTDYDRAQALAAAAFADGSSFSETWANLTNWVPFGTPGVQVSGNKLYSTGSGGGNSGANRSYVLGATGKARLVARVYHNAAAGGGLIIGFSSDTAGAVPTAGAATAKGVYFNGGFIKSANNGDFSTNLASSVTTGTYLVYAVVDAQYMTFTVFKDDGSMECRVRHARSGFNINNLFIFNSSSLALTGSYIDWYGVRNRICPMPAGSAFEGTYNWPIYTGDGTNDWRVLVPKGYDPRVPAPLAICWHGNGSDALHWRDNANGKVVAEALCNAGYIVVGASYAANLSTWGAQASLDAYLAAYRYARDNFAIASTVFYANSMGGIESLNALVQNRLPCAAWAGTSPTANLRNCYDNGFGALIRTAYGIASDGSDYAAKTSGYDPILQPAATLRGVPMLAIAATDDVTVSKAENADALISSVTGTAESATVTSTTGGHSFNFAPFTSAIVNHFNAAVAT